MVYQLTRALHKKSPRGKMLHSHPPALKGFSIRGIPPLTPVCPDESGLDTPRRDYGSLVRRRPLPLSIGEPAVI